MQGRAEGYLERDRQCYPDRDFHRYLRRRSDGDPRRNSQDDMQGYLQDDLQSYLWGGCRDFIGEKRVGMRVPDSIAAIRVHLRSFAVAHPQFWALVSGF